MELRRVLPHVTTRAFWRGMVVGMLSPAGRRGFRGGYRRSVIPGAVGGYSLIQWTRHARLRDGLPPLTSLAELEVSVIGALGATGVVVACTWLWRRWKDARAG
jgi:hypothetical protein